MCGSSCILGISERLNFELGNQLLSAWLPLWPCICFWNVFLVVFFCYLWKWNIFCCDWRVPMIKLLEFLWIGMMGSFAIVLPASSIAWVVATACACAAPEFHAWHQTTKSRSSSSSTSTTLLFQKLHFWTSSKLTEQILQCVFSCPASCTLANLQKILWPKSCLHVHCTDI